MSRRGTPVDINYLLGNLAHRVLATRGDFMESNERYYRRRAFEERIAAQRAVTEPARVWHAKLAEDFAMRAQNAPAALSA